MNLTAWIRKPTWGLGLALLCLFALRARGDDAFEKLWFKGSVEEAYRAAAREGKPLFIYFGAVWCPPCNELKDQVFSKPRFQELIRGKVIPVYIDGDHPSAQTHAENLKAAGYPTILLLDSRGTEILRFASTSNIQEFEQAFGAAMALQGGQRQSINLALSGAAPLTTWQALAYASWEYGGGRDSWGADELSRIKLGLVERVPPELRREKAILIGKLLGHVGELDEEDLKSEGNRQVLKVVSGRAKEYLDFLLADAGHIKAARYTIVGTAKPILTWARSGLSEQDWHQVLLRWIEASEMLRTDPEQSVDVRLWAIQPPLVVYRLIKGEKAPLPARMVEAVQAAAGLADQRAQSYYLRHSVTSGAAYLLAQVDDKAGARQLLLREIASTDTPWYYYSSLAHLELEAGNKPKALEYSRKARESALGRATKMQWTVNDLSMLVENDPRNIEAIEEVLESFYEQVFSLSDGFDGRNVNLAKRVSGLMKGYVAQADIRDILREYAGRCDSLRGEARTNCQRHFSSMLPRPAASARP